MTRWKNSYHPANEHLLYPSTFLYQEKKGEPTWLGEACWIEKGGAWDKKPAMRRVVS